MAKVVEEVARLQEALVAQSTSRNHTSTPPARNDTTPTVKPYSANVSAGGFITFKPNNAEFTFRVDETFTPSVSTLIMSWSRKTIERGEFLSETGPDCEHGNFESFEISPVRPPKGTIRQLQQCSLFQSQLIYLNGKPTKSWHFTHTDGKCRQQYPKVIDR